MARKPTLMISYFDVSLCFLSFHLFEKHHWGVLFKKRANNKNQYLSGKFTKNYMLASRVEVIEEIRKNLTAMAIQKKPDTAIIRMEMRKMTKHKAMLDTLVAAAKPFLKTKDA